MVILQNLQDTIFYSLGFAVWSSNLWWAGGQHDKGGLCQTGQADQTGWFCHQHESGFSDDSSREEDSGQSSAHSGWCQSPSAHCHQQLEKLQWQAGPPQMENYHPETHLCAPCHQTVQLRGGRRSRRTPEDEEEQHSTTGYWQKAKKPVSFICYFYVSLNHLQFTLIWIWKLYSDLQHVVIRCQV